MPQSDNIQGPSIVCFKGRKVAFFLIKQGLGLRGSILHKSTKREDGNFSSLLDFLRNYSPELKSHIHNSPKNARYLSQKIQNEFISINGDMMRKCIVDKCNSFIFWSVMAMKPLKFQQRNK